MLFLLYKINSEHRLTFLLLPHCINSQSSKTRLLMLSCWVIMCFVAPMILWVLSVTPDQRPFVVGVYSLILLFALAILNFGSYLFNPRVDDDTGIMMFFVTRIHSNAVAPVADGTDIAAFAIAV